MIWIKNLNEIYPFDVICSHLTLRSLVPFCPHGAEHFSHSPSIHCGAQSNNPHFCHSAGFCDESQRLSSTVSNVLWLLHVTFLDWCPPPHDTEHASNLVNVHE